jgi:hypothetical protein
MVTLAGPLEANMPLTEVTPIAFTLSDGVQTINNNGPGFVFFTSFLTHRELVYRSLQFHERSQDFIGAHDETFPSRCAP